MRADRKFLWHVLFLWWVWAFYELPDEEFQAALKRKGSPYTAPVAPDATAPRPGAAQARRPR